jgi:hypothetical protein
MKRSMYLLLLSCMVAFIVCLQPVSGQGSGPALPHEFFGKVFVGDGPAPMGFEVEAVGPGVYSLQVELEGKMITVKGNPVTTQSGGVYGESGMSAQKLLVQGDIEPGTPLEFYVGGVNAEVYPVSTNGPWKENYSYFPGEITELNLRIAGQPSVGQTREPTPVQTRLPASAVEAFLPEPGIATGRPVMESPVNPPAENNLPGTITGTPLQGNHTVPVGGQALPGSPGSTPVLMAALVILILVIIGGAGYLLTKNKSGPEKEKESGAPEKEKED